MDEQQETAQATTQNEATPAQTEEGTGAAQVADETEVPEAFRNFSPPQLNVQTIESLAARLDAVEQELADFKQQLHDAGIRLVS